MQTRAILGAAVELKKEGLDPHPEIMVPLTGILYEFESQEKVIRDTAAKLFAEEGVSVDFKVGTMIEIPRAALTADRIATRAEYFSFGTNDLTQMTFGYSRDDIASFLPVYLEKKILKVDPSRCSTRKGSASSSAWPSRKVAPYVPNSSAASAVNTAVNPAP